MLEAPEASLDPIALLLEFGFVWDEDLAWTGWPPALSSQRSTHVTHDYHMFYRREWHPLPDSPEEFEQR